MKKRISCFLIFAFIFCLLFASCDNQIKTGTSMNNKPVSSESTGNDANNSEQKPLADVDGIVKAHFIDVGQGDCEFIELSDGKTMLIDAGDKQAADTVISYIKKLGYKKIDIVIATHPHADHIGGMKDVINSFKIGKIYMPRVENNTKTYEGLLEAILNKGLKIKTAKAGVNIEQTNDYSIDVLSPNEGAEFENINNMSAVIKLKFGNTGILFMADAEYEAESMITADVSCDIIKIGHHGSYNASSEGFLKRTGAKAAIISAGKDNSYGHPHDVAMTRIANIGALIYRTDKLGTVIAELDGNKTSVYQANNAA